MSFRLKTIKSLEKVLCRYDKVRQIKFFKKFQILLATAQIGSILKNVCAVNSKKRSESLIVRI